MILISINVFRQTEGKVNLPVWQLNTSYKGDLVRNFNGGITTGTTYLGLANLFLGFNTENAGLWKGGEFLVHGANTYRGEPSTNLIEDFQVASNIEAGNHTFLYELYHKQFNVFYQLGISPRNDNCGYLDAGCSYSGLFTKTEDDELGLEF